jgi:hypothetical protein
MIINRLLYFYDSDFHSYCPLLLFHFLSLLYFCKLLIINKLPPISEPIIAPVIFEVLFVFYLGMLVNVDAASGIVSFAFEEATLPGVEAWSI